MFVCVRALLHRCVESDGSLMVVVCVCVHFPILSFSLLLPHIYTHTDAGAVNTIGWQYTSTNGVLFRENGGQFATSKYKY